MNFFLPEFIGTLILILLGNGVVANVLLSKSKGQNSGWIVITLGWGMAVFAGVFVAAQFGGASLNPAGTLCDLVYLNGSIEEAGARILGQFAGAIIGAALVFITYRQHFTETEDADLKLAVFCNAPAIRSVPHNLITEIIGTAALIFIAKCIVGADAKVASLNALPVALVVLSIGLSLGGPTGYAINPARDLGPRIAHYLLPIPGKRNSDWGYSWIPVVGPIIGALLGGGFYYALK